MSAIPKIEDTRNTARIIQILVSLLFFRFTFWRAKQGQDKISYVRTSQIAENSVVDTEDMIHGRDQILIMSDHQNCLLIAPDA